MIRRSRTDYAALLGPLLPARPRDLIAALPEVSPPSIYAALARLRDSGAFQWTAGLYSLAPAGKPSPTRRTDPEVSGVQADGTCELVGFGFDAAQAPSFRCPTFGRIPVARCLDQYVSANGHPSRKPGACFGCDDGAKRRQEYAR